MEFRAFSDSNSSALEGIWVSHLIPCSQFGQAVDTYTFSGSSLTARSELYEVVNGQCDRLAMEEVHLLTFNATMSPIARTLDLDFVVGRISITPRSKKIVSDFNRERLCGFSDWTIDTTKILNGVACQGVVNEHEGTQVYSIAKIEDTRLVIGKSDNEHDGSSPPKRHVQFGQDVFIKQ